MQPLRFASAGGDPIETVYGVGYRLRERKGGRLIATATTVQARFDYEAQETRPVEEESKRLIREFEKREIPDRRSGGS